MTDNTPRGIALLAFAKTLKSIRTDKGLNQSELARAAAKFMPDGTFGRDNISNYELGKTLPRDVQLKALASALGVSPDKLMESRGVPRAEDRIPAFEMKAADDGWVWLRVNQKVPMEVASAIMQVLAKAGAPAQ